MLEFHHTGWYWDYRFIGDSGQMFAHNIMAFTSGQVVMYVARQDTAD